MSIDVATSIARILKQEGVEWVSTFPVCRVNNALGREGVPMIMMRDDRYAVALADAYSRVTGGDRIGVCTVQGGVNGAGLQYSYPGLAQAFEDNSPMLCITDGVPAGSTENTQFDVTTSLKTVTKWFGYIDRPERTPEFLRRAFSMLRSGRPGPVVLAVPNAAGIYDETVDPYTPVRGYRSAPDPSDVATAIDLLMGAANPLIYAGEGVIYAGASAELVALAELLNAPVITTLKAKGAFPENHPLFVGVRGEHPIAYLNKSDVILTVGSSLSPGRFSHGIPNAPNKTIIQCSLDEFHLNRIFPTHHAVLGDARFVLQALAAEASRRTDGAGRPAGNVVAEVREARDAGLAEYREAMASNEAPINPYRVFGDMMKVLDPYKSFVTHDSGNTRDQLSTVYETLIPRGFLGWGNISTLGVRAGRRHGSQAGLPGSAVGGGYRRCRRGLYAGQPGGSRPAEPGHHGGARSQRRVRRLRPRLLGRRARSVHPPGAGPGGREYVTGRGGAGPVHGAGHRAVRRHSGLPARHGRQRAGAAILPGVHLLAVSALRRVRAQPGSALGCAGIGAIIGRGVSRQRSPRRYSGGARGQRPGTHTPGLGEVLWHPLMVSLLNHERMGSGGRMIIRPYAGSHLLVKGIFW